MLECKERKLLYIAPPKTGTTSVINALAQPPYNGTVIHGAFTAAHHHTERRPEYHDWFIFITVRHPYVRAWSLYQFSRAEIAKDSTPRRNVFTSWWKKHFEHDSFETFLYNPRGDLRKRWRVSWHTEQIPRNVDKIVRMETFHEDLALISLKVEHLNQGEYSPWHAAVTPRIADRIRQLWFDDFEPFGYNPNLNDCVAGRLML